MKNGWMLWNFFMQSVYFQHAMLCCFRPRATGLKCNNICIETTFFWSTTGTSPKLTTTLTVLYCSPCCSVDTFILELFWVSINHVQDHSWTNFVFNNASDSHLFYNFEGIYLSSYSNGYGIGEWNQVNTMQCSKC